MERVVYYTKTGKVNENFFGWLNILILSLNIIHKHIQVSTLNQLSLLSKASFLSKDSLPQWEGGVHFAGEIPSSEFSEVLSTERREKVGNIQISLVKTTGNVENEKKINLISTSR